ncbi:MAG: putative peptidase M15 [Prokaryotic dsDNA virus sp.]|nr:MAG: putative peptidase M15 [Prokaryotic dsDNA virus sp.]QDP65589.1 MAG: putative peptidase M15 [Prokaryotic dsDNA virus sp.]|tara:strand:- start:29561 stop:29929 length:369 start_codon:yes stop_codon:yes gene_type:complete
MAFNYFDISEFADKSIPNSGFNMNKHFVELLDQARQEADTPFVITSGWRSEATNRRVGGVFNSAHLKGLAVDIAYKGSRQLYLIVNALMKVGINRIGINAKSKFIHCDVDPSKDQNVIWTYN